MSWLRDIDRWFVSSVLPHANSYKAKAAFLCNVSEADDVVQDAYARVLTVADYRSISNPRAFVLAIVHNLAIERLRRSKVVRIDYFASLEVLDVADSAPDAFAITAGRSDLDRLLRHIEGLPPQCRRVILMRKIDGLSPAVIAEQLSISLSTVEKHIAKGLVLLTKSLREDGRPKDHLSTLWKARSNTN